jgi:phage portal protein BeeE
MSFLAAAYQEMQADLAASAWNLNFFDSNNGVPDGFLGLSADTLDADVDRVRMEVRDFFGGTKRGIAVGRSNDLKYTEFGRSQKDMEFTGP